MRGKIFVRARIIACIFVLLSISGCLTKKVHVDSSSVAKTQYSKLTVIGDEHKNGIFDISVEYDDDGNGWMAYSRVEMPKYVATHIARSSNRGETWEYVATVNQSNDGAYDYLGKNHTGVWRSETSSLLYDPSDTAARRWKLFSHRYPAEPPYKKGNALYGEGWIEYKHAKHPGGPWSKPIRLFGKKEKKSLVDLSSLHPDLHNMLWYSEIGSIVVDDVIYLSLDATTTPSGLGEWDQRKIILVSSNDHGNTWRYVGTLTDYEDANSFGYRVFTGSSLTRENQRLFLLISPSGIKGLFKKNRAHDGTMVVEIVNITRAKLKRGPKGKLSIVKWIKPSLESGGLSDYDERNTSGGILFSQIDTSIYPKNVDFFQAYNTRERIIKP